MQNNYTFLVTTIALITLMPNIAWSSPFDEDQDICPQWECDQAGNCRRINLPCGVPSGYPNSQQNSPSSTQSEEIVLFDNGNIYRVDNNPRANTRFQIPYSARVTSITNYHWNNAQGKSPGQIWLLHQDGTTYGPWQATSQPGQGGVPNAYWIVRPNIVIKPGTYTIGDSHPNSWANNQQSGFSGMSSIKAVVSR
ncbi:hypothetical protein IQ225_14595 [Synechocystis salina LEGE 06155]|nr:hypothetical protein [Synechocystis salina LEGE 06155]